MIPTSISSSSSLFFSAFLPGQLEFLSTLSLPLTLGLSPYSPPTFSSLYSSLQNADLGRKGGDGPTVSRGFHVYQFLVVLFFNLNPFMLKL